MLVRLGIDSPRDPGFDCGNDDLNEFFFNDSKLFCSELIAITYAWVDEGVTRAFFSVSNDAVARTVNPSAYKRTAKLVPRHKRFTTLPAVKIGRLAVDTRFQSNGVGTEVLNFIKGWFTEGNKTGCRFIIVDALNNVDTLRFYAKNGFSFSLSTDNDDKTRLMFFDLMTFKR